MRFVQARWWLWVALVGVLALASCGDSASGQTTRPQHDPLKADGPPCRLVYWVPYHNIETTCFEVVLDDVPPPQAAPELMGLALGPDGTLYMARTARGEIWAMRDEDGDQFLDDPFLVAGGLELPTTLTVYDGALYVASVGGLVRLDPAPDGKTFDRQSVLVPDLPGADGGFWPGSVRVGPDERLYVGTGAGCTFCDGSDVRSGMLISYALDGGDRRIEASGLRDPWDFAWHPRTGDLWVIDSGRVIPGVTAVGGPPDELNRVVRGANYGYPACAGDREAVADVPSGSDPCGQTEPPAFTFDAQSNPGGVAFYPTDGFPFWEGDLIVVLRGSWTQAEPVGYAVAAVGFDDAGQPDGTMEIIAPTSESDWVPPTLAGMSLARMGFFPYHPVDVVVSEEGWLYVSVQEGRIFRIRPRPKAKAPQPLTPTPVPPT